MLLRVRVRGFVLCVSVVWVRCGSGQRNDMFDLISSVRLQQGGLLLVLGVLLRGCTSF